jgi:predicted DNA-binding protein (MmcQ/YjbR family)
MTARELRRACLAHRGASEEFPFGPETSVFMVHRKMFALCQFDRDPPLRVNLKCEPELAEQLRKTYPAIRPGWHMNKRHWNTVVLDGSLPRQLVFDLIEDSYDLVVAGLPRAKRAALDWPGDAAPAS